MQTIVVDAQPITQFSYDDLPESKRLFVLEKTQQIKTYIRKSAQTIIEIGDRLLSVKQELEHGQWESWLFIELGWEPRTARRYMAVSDHFKSDNLSDLDNIAPSALYTLVQADSTEEARQEALDRASSGERITIKTAQEIKDKANRRKRNPPSAPPPSPFDEGDTVYCIVDGPHFGIEMTIVQVGPRNASQYLYECWFTDANERIHYRTFYEAMLSFESPSQEEEDDDDEPDPPSLSTNEEDRAHLSAIASSAQIHVLEETVQELEEQTVSISELLADLFHRCTKLPTEQRDLVLGGGLGDRIETALFPGEEP